MLFLCFLLLALLGLLNKQLLRILAICLVAFLIYKEFYYRYNSSHGRKNCFWCHFERACSWGDKSNESKPTTSKTPIIPAVSAEEGQKNTE